MTDDEYFSLIDTVGPQEARARMLAEIEKASQPTPPDPNQPVSTGTDLRRVRYPWPEEQMAEAPQERPSYWGQLKNDLDRGADILTASGGGILAAAGDLLGSRGMTEAGLDIYMSNMEEVKQNPALIGSFTNISSVDDGVRYLIEAVGENALMMLPGIATGGVSGMLGRRLVQTAAEKAVARLVAGGMSQQAAAKAVTLSIQDQAKARLRDTAFQTLGAYPTSAGMETGLIAGEIYEKTGEVDGGLALAGGSLAGALDTIPNVMALRMAVGREAAGEVVDKFYKALGKNVAKEFLTEAPTEAFQEIINAATVAQKTGEDIFTEENIIGYVDAALKGGLGSAPIAAGSTIIGRLGQDTSASREAFQRTGERENQQQQEQQQQTPDPTIDDALGALDEDEQQSAQDQYDEKSGKTVQLAGTDDTFAGMDDKTLDKVEAELALRIENPQTIDPVETKQAEAMLAAVQAEKQRRANTAAPGATDQSQAGVAGSTPAPATPAKKGGTSAGAVLNTAQSAFEIAFRSRMRARLAAGEKVVFSKPDSIEAARNNPYYEIQDLPDGTVQVVGVKPEGSVQAPAPTQTPAAAAPAPAAQTPAKPRAQIPPPPAPIISDTTTLEEIESEISLRQNAFAREDFGPEGNQQLQDDIAALEQEAQARRAKPPVSEPPSTDAPAGDEGGTYQIKKLDEQAAADFLGIPVKEVTQLAAAGRIPGTQVGDKWEFTENELTEWLKGVAGEGATGVSQSLLEGLLEELDDPEKENTSTTLPAPPQTKEPEPTAQTLNLSPEAAAELEAATRQHEQNKATIKSLLDIGNIDQQEFGKRSKAEGMRFAAEKRRITGQLTPKEQAAKEKREAGNYIGKPVEVDGKPGKVVGNPFGRVRVKLDEDGSVITTTFDKVKPRSAASVPPVAETPVDPPVEEPAATPVENTDEDAATDDFAGKLKAAKTKREKQELVNASAAEGTLASRVVNAAQRGKPLPRVEGTSVSPDIIDSIPDSPDTSRVELKPVSKKSPEKAAAPFASTDNSRPQLAGVHYDPENKSVIATDGRVLISIPSEDTGDTKRTVATRTFTKEEWDGKKTQIKKGDILEEKLGGNFPNWKQVVPAPTKKDVTFDVDIEETRKAAAVLSGVNTPLAAGLRGDVAAISVGEANFDPDYIYKSVTALAESGASKIEATLSDPGSSAPVLTLRGDNGAFAIVMPKRVSAKMRHDISGKKPAAAATQPKAAPKVEEPPTQQDDTVDTETNDVAEEDTISPEEQAIDDEFEKYEEMVADLGFDADTTKAKVKSVTKKLVKAGVVSDRDVKEVEQVLKSYDREDAVIEAESILSSAVARAKEKRVAEVEGARLNTNLDAIDSPSFPDIRNATSPKEVDARLKEVKASIKNMVGDNRAMVVAAELAAKETKAKLEAAEKTNESPAATLPRGFVTALIRSRGQVPAGPRNAEFRQQLMAAMGKTVPKSKAGITVVEETLREYLGVERGETPNATYERVVEKLQALLSPDQTPAQDQDPMVSYSGGDKIKFNGKTQQISGGTFYEFEYLEGRKKGEIGVTMNPPASVRERIQTRIETPEPPAPAPTPEPKAKELQNAAGVVLTGEEAKTADHQIVLAKAQSYYTLWLLSPPDKQGRRQSNYVTILGQNLEEARRKAIEVGKRILAGDTTGFAFYGQAGAEVQQNQTLGLLEEVLSKDQLAGLNRGPVGSSKVGFGKNADLIVDDVVAQNPGWVEYMLTKVSSPSGRVKTVVDYLKQTPLGIEILESTKGDRERIAAYEQRQNEKLTRKQTVSIENTTTDNKVQNKKVEKKKSRKASEQIVDIVAAKSEKQHVPQRLAKNMFPIQVDGANSTIESLDKHGASLNGDGAGVGKTRQILAVADHYARQGLPVVIITENAAIGKPWEGRKVPVLGGSMAKDSQAMGVKLSLLDTGETPANGEIRITTYNRVEANQIPDNAVIIFDESQNLANTFGDISKPKGNWKDKFTAIFNKAGRTAFYSATPADKPHQLAYLYKVLGFGSPQEYLAEAQENGMIIRTRRFGSTEQKLYDVPRSETAKRKLYGWVNGKILEAGAGGRAIKREISYEGTDIQFHDTKGTDPAKNPWAEKFLQVMADLQGAMAQGWILPALESHILYSAELAKIGDALNMVKRELAAGRKVVLFFSRIRPHTVRGRKLMASPDGETMMGDPVDLFSIESPVVLLREELEKLGVSYVELHGQSGDTSKTAQEKFGKNVDVMLASVESGGTGINLDDTTGKNPRTEIFMFAPYRGISTIQAMGRVWRSSTVQDDNNPNRYIFVVASDISQDAVRSAVLAKKLQLMNASLGGTAVSRLPMSKVGYSPDQLVGIELPESGVESPVMAAEEYAPGPLLPVEIRRWGRTKNGEYIADATADLLEWMERGGPERTGLQIRVFKGREGNWIALAAEEYTADQFELKEVEGPVTDNTPAEPAPKDVTEDEAVASELVKTSKRRKKERPPVEPDPEADDAASKNFYRYNPTTKKFEATELVASLPEAERTRINSIVERENTRYRGNRQGAAERGRAIRTLKRGSVLDRAVMLLGSDEALTQIIARTRATLAGIVAKNKWSIPSDEVESVALQAVVRTLHSPTLINSIEAGEETGTPQEIYQGYSISSAVNDAKTWMKSNGRRAEVPLDEADGQEAPPPETGVRIVSMTPEELIDQENKAKEVVEQAGAKIADLRKRAAAKVPAGTPARKFLDAVLTPGAKTPETSAEDKDTAFRAILDARVEAEGAAAVFGGPTRDGDETSEDKADNTFLVSEEAYDAALKALRRSLGQTNLGVDPTALANLIKIGAYHAERGARKFGMWAEAMLADLGDSVRSLLKKIYNHVKEVLRGTKTGFDTKAKVRDAVVPEAILDQEELDTLLREVRNGATSQRLGARAREDAAPGVIERLKQIVDRLGRESEREEEVFFKKVWAGLLNRTRRQLSVAPGNFREAARRAVADIEEFVRNNPKFAQYYTNDWKLTRALLEDFFQGPLTDGEFTMFRLVAGLTSAQTQLAANMGDAVNLFNHWKTEGTFDDFVMGPNENGNLVVLEKPFEVSGTSANTKVRTVKIFERLVRQTGSIENAIKYLQEPVSVKDLQQFNRDMGYKSPVNSVGAIRELVRQATGQSDLIPRMFIFGPKVGAYTLNAIGDSRYTTVDIWESRFIRSYFKDMFEKNTGLPASANEHAIFNRFIEVFKDEFQKATGKEWENSALQALRWFYILDAAKKAGYTRANTNETISFYTEQKLRDDYGYTGPSRTDTADRGQGDAAGGTGDQGGQPTPGSGVGRLEAQPGATSQRLGVFAGERAQMPQFMRDSLDTARAMALAGKSSEEIRAVTGWFPGKYDGKMRWEIPDNKASFIERKFERKPPTILRGEFVNGSFIPDPDGSYVAEVDGKPAWWTAGDTREESESRYFDSMGREISYGFGVDGKLFDVIEHGDLFKAYPSAKDIQVVFAPMPPTTQGLFRSNSNTIVIDSNLDKDEALPVLLHEVQHWVQKQEGFARGSNPENQKKKAEFEERVRQAALYKSSPENAWSEVGPETNPDVIASQMYLNEPGEIEARDVGARGALTPEQRKAVEPYSSENISPEAATAIGEVEGETESASSRAASPDQDARFAELEARARAGDKEAEAEARRMVDGNRPFTKVLLGDASDDGIRSSSIEVNQRGVNSQNHGTFGFNREHRWRFRPYTGLLTLTDNIPQFTREEIKNHIRNKGYGISKIAPMGDPDAFKETHSTFFKEIPKVDTFTYDDAGNLIPLSQRFDSTSNSILQAQPEREVYVPPVTRKYRKRQAERQAGQAAAQKLKDMIRETFPGVTVQEDNSDPDSVLYYDPEKDSIVVNPEEFYRLLPENPTPDAIDRILGALMTHEVVHNAVIRSIDADPANNDKFYAVQDWLFSGNLWKQVVRRYNWDREMTDQEVEDFVSDNGREYVTHEFLRMQAELITQGRTTEALILLGKNPPQNIIDGIIAYLQKMADQLMAWIQRRSSNGAIDEMLDLINQHLDVLRSPTAQDRVNHLVAVKSTQNHSNRKLFANVGGRVIRSIRETETRFTESFLASRPFYSSTVRTALENLTYEGETMKELFDEATQLLVNTMRAGGPSMGAEAAYRQVSGYTPQEGMDANLRVAVQMVTADWFEQMSRGFRSRNTPEAQRAAEYYDQRTADIRVEIAEKSLSPAGQTLSIASYALRKLRGREFGHIYKKPTTAAQQQKLDGDPAAQEIEQEVEDAVDTAADNTVDKADKLINKLEDKAKAATPDTGLDKTGEDAVKDLLDTTEDIKKEATKKEKPKKTGDKKKRARKEDEDKSNQPKAIDPERVIERVAEKLEKVIKNAGLTAEQRAAAKRNPFFETILTGTTLATVRKQFEDLLSAQQVSETDSEKAKEAKLRRAIVGLVAQVQELDIAKAAFEEAKARAIDAAFEGDIEMNSGQLEEIEAIEFDDTKIPNAAKVLKGAVNIRELVRKSLKAQRTSVSRLAADIAEAVKLSPEQADVVARALEAEYKKAAKVEIEKAIEKLVQSNDPAIRKAIKSKSTHDKLFEAANLGALRRETVWNAIAQNYDLPSFDPAFVREIEKRAQRIQDLPENSQQRNLETRLLMTDIAYRQVSEAKGVQKFLRNLDVFMAMWKAGILSGPPTQAVNFGFSHINLLLNASAKAQALARMGKIKNNKDAKSYLGYLTTLLMGTYSQLGRAKNEAVNALNYGYSRFNNEKIENLGILEGFKFDPNNKFNLKNVVSLYKFVGRFMQASDVFNSSMASEMAQHAAVESYILQNNLTKEEAGKLRAKIFDNSEEIRAKAVKQADEEAARGDFGPAGSKADRLRLSRIEEIIERQREKHISGVIERGRSEGERISYNNPAERLIGFVMRGLFAPLNRTLRITQPLMPFPNTIANLLNTTIDYTPYGYLRARNISISDLLAKSGKLSDEFAPKELKEGTLEYEETIAKAHMGSIGIAAIFGLVLMGWFDRDEEPDEEPFFEVTAEGPSDLTAREQLRSTGWMPYTVKIGGLRLRYTDWPALNIALGAFGTLTDRYVYDKKRDFTPGDILPAIISVFSTTLDRNMLSGMSDFFDIVNNPNTKGANTLLRLTTGFVGGVTNPNLLRWTRNTFGADETGMVPRIEQRTLAGKFASLAPFSGGYSQASLNIFGEPIRSFASEATTNRFGSFFDKEHPIITPLANKGLFLTDPSYQVVFSIPRGRKVEDYKLTPSEQRDFSRIRGPILKKLLKPSEVSRITALASRDYDTAKEELRKISTTATQQAKAIYAKRRGWAR